MYSSVKWSPVFSPAYPRHLYWYRSSSFASPWRCSSSATWRAFVSNTSALRSPCRNVLQARSQLGWMTDLTLLEISYVHQLLADFLIRFVTQNFTWAQLCVCSASIFYYFFLPELIFQIFSVCNVPSAESSGSHSVLSIPLAGRCNLHKEFMKWLYKQTQIHIHSLWNTFATNMSSNRNSVFPQETKSKGLNTV